MGRKKLLQRYYKPSNLDGKLNALQKKRLSYILFQKSVFVFYS